METLRGCLFTVGAVITLLINGLLYLVSCVWSLISMAYYAAINFIGENKLALVVTTVSLALVLTYLTAKTLGY